MTDLTTVWNAIFAAVSVGIVWSASEKLIKLIRNKIKNRNKPV